MTVSVNLSARELDEPGLVDSVRDALAETGLDPAHLVLEITESLLLVDLPATVGKLLSALRVAGRPARRRRLRHRLLLAGLPREPAGRHPEDRQVLRRPHRRVPGGHAPASTTPQQSVMVSAISQLGHALHLRPGRRGHRAAGAGQRAARARLPVRPGLLLRPAADPRRARPSCCTGRPPSPAGTSSRRRDAAPARRQLIRGSSAVGPGALPIAEGRTRLRGPPRTRRSIVTSSQTAPARTGLRAWTPAQRFAGRLRRRLPPGRRSPASRSPASPTSPAWTTAHPADLLGEPAAQLHPPGPRRSPGWRPPRATAPPGSPTSSIGVVLGLVTVLGLLRRAWACSACPGWPTPTTSCTWPPPRSRSTSARSPRGRRRHADDDRSSPTRVRRPPISVSRYSFSRRCRSPT